jgi:hypothetical protein
LIFDDQGALFLCFEWGEFFVPYTVPDFNLTFEVWPVGQLPDTGGPPYNVPGQLYLQSRAVILRAAVPATYFVPASWIRTNSTIVATESMIVNGCILGTKDSLANWLYYKVYWWDWEHLGFGNEYVMLMVDQVDGMGINPDARRG